MLKEGIKDKAGDMTEERIQLLESIGFEWDMKSGVEKENWIDRYNELKEFKEKNGHTRVSEKENKSLHEWAKAMRCQYNRYNGNQRDCYITEDQFNQLKEIELDSSLRESKFDQRFKELMEFKEQHGHCVVPSNYPLNTKLSNWCQTQKRQYKLLREGKAAHLT